MIINDKCYLVLSLPFRLESILSSSVLLLDHEKHIYPLKSLSYQVYKLRYKYVQLNGRHLGILTLEQRGKGAKLHPTPSFFLNISVARRNFSLRFGIFLEPSKRDEMTLRFLK